ncbi:hypothetical protein CV_1819 [Chromobacterium violaceum ATCC 12472]|uniref:Uncharacterized protein n=1 Tax=Chromobacterium violaceum (strain ATCC 12472 / DSM 30191 / JCM 1249 / CCUG 213 / NBRC 12614 / NCIMB 9131 / NCTC 9757 / MK) TaxID=243365 RepID=Q7NX10_CHRVO|nr:hypothetical protein CV_1819 [Chromobacterium violaceum ATCC 12472]
MGAFRKKCRGKDREKQVCYESRLPDWVTCSPAILCATGASASPPIPPAWRDKHCRTAGMPGQTSLQNLPTGLASRDGILVSALCV